MNFITFFQSLLFSGVATTVATEILKSPYIPVDFQKYPRLTTIAAAVIASAVAVHQSGVSLNDIHGFAAWGSMAIGTIILAVFTYRNLITQG